MERIYRYDGSFEGFLCCVFDSYQNREVPGGICPAEELEASLFPIWDAVFDPDHARRVLAKVEAIAPAARSLVERGFLTCAPEREMMLYRFIRSLLREGAPLLQRLSHDDVLPLRQAVQHLEGEAHLLKGFVRFSDLGGFLVGEIQPKNRVLPLLGRHFCQRCLGERFLLYDRTHKEALLGQEGRWCVMPLAEFTMALPDETEAKFRRLWKTFYDTVAIRERYNPKTRRTHMPMRYWGTMTEFQGEEFFTPAAQTPGAGAPEPGAPAGIPAPGTPSGSGRPGPGSGP